MSMYDYIKTLLLIVFAITTLTVSAQREPMLTRNQSHTFGVPVVTEDKGDGWINTYYVVEPGNTLYSISRQFEMTVEEVRKINNLSTNVILVGERLLIMKEAVDKGSEQTDVQEAHAETGAYQPVLTPSPAPRTAPLPAQAMVAPAKKQEELAPAATDPDAGSGMIIIDNLDDNKPASEGSRQ